ncbi:MAG: PVC-type heme-binding CxxCH protein, partial [Prosthecobacter sp.]|nr:PVC-type heme-binding CxxCH protein [Prosthecobacter sp.]
AALHVPEGFTVQLFASEPMINKPINMAFDARGRLWVSSTVEYPYSADKSRWSDAQGRHVKDSRDAIKILEDTDGDGRADKVTDFADGLNIPTGVLPWHKPEHKDGCIAWSIPNIWYFADTDGDGKADLREVLFGPLGYEKDTHGMCSSFRLGLDGWVYATHGFNNTSHIKAKDGSSLDLHSGNVFRFRPDGSHVEIWSWGQVNPFGLCFDRYGNLYSADCHSAPIYQLLHGAHYPSFGKPDDGLGFGPVMCEHTHGSTGICGIAYIDSGVWGPEWDDHMFVGNVVTSRVNHDHVTFTGSTSKANEQPDFLTSDDSWFRPVDIQLGPDSALYIADFYNKIIGHYEVPLDHPGRDKERGRIWRVVKTGAKPAQRVIRRPEIGETKHEWQTALKSDLAFVRRAAVEALQEHPSLEALSSLLELTGQTPKEDVQLHHALRLALREHLKVPGAFASLPASAHPLVSPIVLAVPTTESAQFVLQTLATSNNASAALAHIARYGDPALLPQAMSWAKLRTSDNLLAQVSSLNALYSGLSERGAPASSELLHWAQELSLQLLATLDKQPVVSWEPVTQTGAEPAWSLIQRMCADDAEAQVLQSMKGGGDEEKRTGTLRSKPFVTPAKLTFWINGHRGFPTSPPHDKNLVRLVDATSGEVLTSIFPPRSDKCEYSELDLTKFAGRQARLEIVDGDNGRAYAWLGITRIDPPVVSVNDFHADDATRTALRVLATLLQHTAPAALREKLTAFLPARPAPPPLPVSPEQRRQLDALIAGRSTALAKANPDLAKGQQVFSANCAVCHQVGGQGGLIGPQLDGIGNRGAARLCEDILDPNRNVDAHFHLHALKLKDGLTTSGFLKGEVGQVTIIADAAGQEHRVPKSEIVEDQTIPMSLMPPVFGQTIPEADFVNLLSWLLTK